MTNVLISAAGLCGATIIGAILGFFVKELPHKWNDAVLGYCAGIMLAASTLGLIVPAFEQTSLWWLVVIGVMAGALFLNVLDLVTPHLHHITGLDHKWNDAVLGYCAGIMLAASTLGLIVPAFEQTSLWWLVVIGVMAGALFLNVLDLVTPHLHHITGLDPEEHRNNARLSHVMLFVMAIALHKLPEGMAAGVSVCSAEGATEWGVSFGIALQNIPEGMVIIAPLMMAGVSAPRTFFISIFIALLEVVGILLGFGLGSASSTFLPVMLGFAGGAMLYVTSDEMIPETHAHGFQKQATYALLLGFITFVLMEKCV